uniref:Uncharacterized protein n=1 Tax=Heliothis virescens TaxID=7102 RepID=A0A2A4ITV8_HELVI
MNNWRLLLLAIVAVVQPIASFTDRNLIDGRQQCCDHPSSAPLRDTRSSLRGTYRLSETTALRGLSGRDEIRQSRRSTEKRLIEDRERTARQDPSPTARSTRVEHRLERSENSLSRERLLDTRQREGSARYSRDLNLQEFNRRVLDRTSRNAVERRDVTESSRDSLFRDDYRTERFANERLSKNLLETRREMQFRSDDRRPSLNRDARHVIRTKVDDIILEVPDNMNIRKRFTRERSAVRREPSTRSDTQRHIIENDSYRREQRSTDQRRSLSENTRSDRIRDMHRGLNTREENREKRRISYLRSNEFSERREQDKENTERRGSERMQVARRDTRESRILNTQNERNTNDRKNVRESRIMNTLNRREANVRREISVRDEIRENLEQRQSRERILMDRRNIRETRNTNVLRERHVDNRQEIRFNEIDTRNTEDQRDYRVQARHIREFRLINNLETGNGRRVDSRREIRSNNLMRDSREGNSLNTESRLSREINKMEIRNIRGNVDSRREIRNDGSRFTEKRIEIRQDREQILSRERSQMDRRTQEFRSMNDIVNRRERDTENQREIRNEAREINKMEIRNIRGNVNSRREIRNDRSRFTDKRIEIRQDREQIMSRERSQMDRRTQEFRTMNDIVNRRERDTENQREIRNEARLHSDNRGSRDYRLSRERTQIERRNSHESRPVTNPHERDTDSRREIRNEARLHSENRGSPDYRLSRDRTQIERRNSRESRTVINPHERDTGNRREIRNEARLHSENRGSPDYRLSRERTQIERRNSRDSRPVINPHERDTDSRREVRNEARLHSENRSRPDYRLSRERTQIERRNSRESRTVTTPHERDSRQEIRDNKRVSRESREEMRESLDRYSMTREGRELDLRNIRESRMYRVTTRNERRTTTRIERDTENRRDVSNNQRLSNLVRGNIFTRMSRIESRSADRVNAQERDNLMLDRRTRSVDRRSFREIRDEARLSRSVDDERRTEVFRSRMERTNIENRERESIDSRSRNVKTAAAYERTNSVVVDKMETENYFGIANWQYVLYTLQAAYICSLFVQMLKPNHTEKPRKMKLHWLPISSHYNPIKVD